MTGRRPGSRVQLFDLIKQGIEGVSWPFLPWLQDPMPAIGVRIPVPDFSALSRRTWQMSDAEKKDQMKKVNGIFEMHVTKDGKESVYTIDLKKVRGRKPPHLPIPSASRR